MPRDTEIADYIVRGRLGNLILANAAGLELPNTRPLERPKQPLSEYEKTVAMGAIRSLTSREIGSWFGPGQSSPKTVERNLHAVMSRMGVASRAQLARHLYCLGIATPDENVPEGSPNLTPTHKLVLGLVSHGLSNAGIVAATQPWLSDNAVKRTMIVVGDELRLASGMVGGRRDAALTVSLAFEQEVFGTHRDKVMSPDFLIPGMQRLLDPEHELILPKSH